MGITFFWENIRNFMTVGFFVKNIRNIFQGKILRLGFLTKYKKVFQGKILRPRLKSALGLC